MAEKLTFVAGLGHPCGVPFRKAEFLREHKQFAWQESLLQDVTDHGWALVGPLAQPPATATH
jgi:hypothetical protein